MVFVVIDISHFIDCLFSKLLTQYVKLGGMSRPGRKELIESLGLAVRRSIAGAILFNQKVADEVGINLRDLQVIHLLQLHGPSQPPDLPRSPFITPAPMTVALIRFKKSGY